jgi:hypothetical protein
MLGLVDDLNKTVSKRLSMLGTCMSSESVRRATRKDVGRKIRAFVSNSDISLAGASSRLWEESDGRGWWGGDCVSKPDLYMTEDLQSHDNLSEAVPKATSTHQRGEPHALSLSIERVPHARAERRWDRKISVIPANREDV